MPAEQLLDLPEEVDVRSPAQKQRDFERRVADALATGKSPAYLSRPQHWLCKFALTALAADTEACAKKMSACGLDTAPAFARIRELNGDSNEPGTGLISLFDEQMSLFQSAVES